MIKKTLTAILLSTVLASQLHAQDSVKKEPIIKTINQRIDKVGAGKVIVEYDDDRDGIVDRGITKHYSFDPRKKKVTLEYIQHTTFKKYKRELVGYNSTRTYLRSDMLDIVEKKSFMGREITKRFMGGAFMYQLESGGNLGLSVILKKDIDGGIISRESSLLDCRYFDMIELYRNRPKKITAQTHPNEVRLNYFKIGLDKNNLPSATYILVRDNASGKYKVKSVLDYDTKKALPNYREHGHQTKQEAIQDYHKFKPKIKKE